MFCVSGLSPIVCRRVYLNSLVICFQLPTILIDAREEAAKNLSEVQPSDWLVRNTRKLLVACWPVRVRMDRGTAINIFIP